jgi:flagellar biosynthesis/type III secretory pathway protein FliH
MGDPMMQKAKEALENLSADPSVQELARQRELGMIGYQLDLNAARKQGKAEGRAEGEARGRADGMAEGRGTALRDAVARLCKVFGIELDERNYQRLQSMSDTDLQALLETIAKDRRFPPVND